MIDPLRSQIDETRRLIEQSRTLIRMTCEDMQRSRQMIADARQIMDAVPVPDPLFRKDT
jgi:hypothetical protein